MLRMRHLVRRFVQTARGREPDRDDLIWVAGQLTPGEKTLFDRMTPTDQAHSIEVARLATASVGSASAMPAWATTAALLHDIGKIESGAGLVGRVIATVIDPVLPGRLAARLQLGPGPIGAIGRHLAYPELGASLLGAIGSDQFVRAWAEQHHLPEGDWTIPHDVGRALRSADDRAS